MTKPPTYVLMQIAWNLTDIPLDDMSELERDIGRILAHADVGLLVLSRDDSGQDIYTFADGRE